MTEAGSGAADGLGGDFAKLGGRVRPPYGDLAVLGGDSGNQRGQEDPKQSQRQGVADKIDKKEAAAIETHVAHQCRQVMRGKVMADVHRKRHIGRRQRIPGSIGTYNWDIRMGGGENTKIDAHDLHSEPAA